MLLTVMFVLSSLPIVSAKNGKLDKKLKLGIEVLLSEQKELIKGKRVGVITNSTGVDKKLTSIVDLLYNDNEIELTALYGPEHGVRGSVQAGEYVEFYLDDITGLPVYSLYGQTRKPTSEMLEKIDVLLFDIQDVGSRFYTYIYTMAYAMEAAKEKGIPIIVLDRPNPLTGSKVDGTVLDMKYASFVGNYSIPLRHGMTVGELAQLFNREFKIGAGLTVVKMKGWKRDMYYDDTSLPFVLPSPNMPTLDTAIVYSGSALFEGTNISEGRGTTKPFELIGAPFINRTDLAQRLNALKLPGVMFRAASFIPANSKFANQLSHGVQIHITDRKKFQSFETGLHMMKIVHDLYPDQFQFQAANRAGISFFDQLVGNGWIRQGIEEGRSVKDMKKQWEKELDEFKKIRSQYLLYE
ncbi:exo-beta-N-acetylmuramidase NamZ domain-containing protein [Peribacillus loiseleuriae]|uniref:exo-beta-N-acetylmuramidase NamZ family protein n=1 Tax=Peribacillus loiseleuriae TaxID=1679170 RepID=UPI003830012A